MADTLKPYRMIEDFVTGRQVPEVGPEANRQAIERLLVTEKGYAGNDIAVDVPIEFVVDGQRYASQLDLVVSVDAGATPVMVIKCVAGSLGSCEREVLSSARVFDPRRQVPLAVVSDGKTAVVFDTVSGRKIGEDLLSIPGKSAARDWLDTAPRPACPAGRLERERLIFRTYNCEYVNVARHLPRQRS
ncbi:MAG: type I restriction enzyme HsdR N-terminal domain-containing protein [Desulfobacterales bacterium]